MGCYGLIHNFNSECIFLTRMRGDISMLLDIFPGRNYSRIKLWFETKRFFHYFKLGSEITSPNCNYIIRIRRHSVKIIASTAITKKEIETLREYIKTVFNGWSILVDSADDLQWITNLENVSVVFLKTNSKDR